MPCPLPIIDDIASLQSLSGARLSKAQPHPGSVPKSLEADRVNDDYRFVVDFLLSYGASADTFNAYRREVDRFLLWCWHVRKSHLPEIKRNDIENYLDFIKNPPLDWRGTERKRRFIDDTGLRIPNPEWKPFVAHTTKSAHRAGQTIDEKQWSQSQSALKSTIAILRTFFEFLLNEEFINRNPVAQIKSRSRKAASSQRKTTIKRLNNQQITALHQALDDMKISLGEEQYERMRFMLACLTAMYLRISEIASSGDRQPVHGDFYYKTHTVASKQEKTWWFRVLGKGNKLRDIPVSDDLLEALKRYRTQMGLSPLPAIGESLALFLKAKGKGGLTSTRHVRSLLQSLFDQAAEKLRLADHPEDADGLYACTVHWLRHTGISEDVQHRPLSHVRDGAGHASIATTGVYVENDDYEVHQSAKYSSILKQRAS